MKLEDLDDVLTVSEVSKFLKVSEPTIYEEVKKKRIETIRVGRQIRIMKYDLRKYINHKE